MNTAKIIAITKPLITKNNSTFVQYEPEEPLEADEFIAYCARVSNPSNQMNTETAPKLLKYLIKNKHWSPFELVSIVMDITTTRDIGRQILRHRSFSFQEFSQRYANPTEDLGFTFREARLQDSKNRQNSTETDDQSLKEQWKQKQDHAIWYAKSCYDWAIENGIAKEQARTVLPEGLTVSRMYMAGSLRSWIHYCNLRMSHGTQKEHSEVATNCWNEILEYFPSLKGCLE